MDGSQLPTEWTHLNFKQVPGVSDSKKRDGSPNKTDTASKKGPMSEKIDEAKMSKTSKISDVSKKVPMAEQSDSGTNG